MALPIGPLKTHSGLELVPRANPVPTSPLADDSHYAISTGDFVFEFPSFLFKYKPVKSLLMNIFIIRAVS